MRSLLYLCRTLEKNSRCRSWRSTSDYYTACFTESIANLRELPSVSRILCELKLSARLILYYARLLDDIVDGHAVKDQTLIALAEKGLAAAREKLVQLVRDEEFSRLFDRLIRTSIDAFWQRHRGLLTSPRSGGRMSMFLAITPAVACYLTGTVAHVKSWIAIVRHTMNGIQLTDDLLDWEEDLKDGVLTPVTTILLSVASKEERTTHLNYLIQVAEEEFTAAERMASHIGANSWKEACRIWRSAIIHDRTGPQRLLSAIMA